MSRIAQAIRSRLDKSLGRCPRCMRQSFLAALAACGLVVFVRVTTNDIAITVAFSVAALGLIALWFAHLMAYAMRAAYSKKPDGGHGIAPSLSRRQLIPVFARTLGAIALVTALPKTTFAAQINDCLTCCAKMQVACGNSGACNVNYQNCVSNCNSQGESPSEWKCW